MVGFILNNQTVSSTQPAGSTVLDYVRYQKRLTGTKIGCREGDCGACTVLVGSFEDCKLVYRSMTSCLMPLGNAAGKHIVTVEGINQKELTSVQQAMVDTNGTQCGFCTLGFVMSFTGFSLSPHRSYESAVASVDGNICRCTGYKSIERSAQIIANKMADKPEENPLLWLVEQNFLPPYFLTIEERLKGLANEQEAVRVGPVLPVAGGTDLLVQRPLTVKQSNVQLLFGNRELKGIRQEETACILGGGVTVTEFVESKLIHAIFPELPAYIKLVSSTPIRNMATIAGNLVNASPIGDMTVFLLALNASIVLADKENKRTIKLKDFYIGYKQTDRSPEEVITEIRFAVPPKEAHFSFEKVSKRTNLDIASVNSACLLTVEGSMVKEMNLSAGGVAPFPKYLKDASSYLEGKTVNELTLKRMLQLVDGEIAPISDARGSSDYKRLLLRQLVLAHFLKVLGPIDPIQNCLL